MSVFSAEMLCLSVGVIGYSGFMIWFFLTLPRHFKKKEIVHQEQLLSAKYKAEKDLYEAQLEIQEQTFDQVSREIHDNVGQFLSLAKLGLTTLDFENPRELEISIGEVSDIIEKSVADLRDISRAMNADIVRRQGLKQAIETQVGFLQRAGRFHISFEFEGSDADKNPQKEVILYRILQESINNIIKHSRANEINIFLSHVKNQLKLLIQDNGDGFDLEMAMAGSGRPGGLLNMKNRANLINADFKIESGVGRGTTIMVTTTN